MVMADIADFEMVRAPALAGTRVVAVGHAGSVRLLDLTTGATLWTCELAAEPGASACDGQAVTVGIVDEIVIAGSMGHVFAIARDSGAVLWHADQRSRGAGETSLAFGARGVDRLAELEE